MIENIRKLHRLRNGAGFSRARGYYRHTQTAHWLVRIHGCVSVPVIMGDGVFTCYSMVVPGG